MGRHWPHALREGPAAPLQKWLPGEDPGAEQEEGLNLGHRCAMATWKCIRYGCRRGLARAECFCCVCGRAVVWAAHPPAEVRSPPAVRNPESRTRQCECPRCVRLTQRIPELTDVACGGSR